MRIIGSKGVASIILASAAIVLLAFAMNSATQAQDSSGTLLKMQLARETALKTENAVRVLDKTTSDGFLETAQLPNCNSNGAGNVSVYINDVITKMNNLSGVKCAVSNLIINPGNAQKVNGTIKCGIGVNGFNITDSQNISFDKKGDSTTGVCTIKDEISTCQEELSFNCP